MKAKELADELMKYPDYDVYASVMAEDGSEDTCGWYEITGNVSGLAYNDPVTRTITLDAED